MTTSNTGKKIISTEDGKFQIEVGNNRVVAKNSDDEEKITIEESDLQITKKDSTDLTFDHDRSSSYGLGFTRHATGNVHVNVSGSANLLINSSLVGTGNLAAGLTSFAILNWAAYETSIDFAHLIGGPGGSGGSVVGTYQLREYNTNGQVLFGTDSAVQSRMCVVSKTDGSTQDVYFRGEWLELEVTDQVTTGTA